MSSKRVSTRRPWRYVFRGPLVAVLEQHADGRWYVFIDGVDVGACGSEAAAEQLVDKIAAAPGGGDGH